MEVSIPVGVIEFREKIFVLIYEVILISPNNYIYFIKYMIQSFFTHDRSSALIREFKLESTRVSTIHH